MADDALFEPEDKPEREPARVRVRPARGPKQPGLGTEHSDGIGYRNVVPLGGNERALPDWLDNDVPRGES